MSETIEIIKTNIPIINDTSNNISESSNVSESVITENIDFSAMSKREILDFCSNSPFYLGQFAKLFCRNINDDITTFFTTSLNQNGNDNIKEAFVHVFFDEETEEFKYVIDLQEDSYPNILCIKLTLEEIDTSKPEVSIFTEEKSLKAESN